MLFVVRNEKKVVIVVENFADYMVITGSQIKKDVLYSLTVNLIRFFVYGLKLQMKL